MRLLAPTAGQLAHSLVIENSTSDIVGLAAGASLAGNCNGVQENGIAALITGQNNVDTAPPSASVDAAGVPINLVDIVDACEYGLPLDIRNNPRPVNSLFDRGAYEMP